MLPKQIEKLGKLAFSQSLKAIKKCSLRKNAILGVIDIEFKKNEKTLAIGISIEGKHLIYYPKSKLVTKEELKEVIGIFYKTVKQPETDRKTAKHLFLTSFWSTAELSQIENFWEGIDSKVYNVAPNLINVPFKINKWLTVTIMDIFHFFADFKGSKSLDSIAKYYGIEGKMSLEGIDGKSESFWKTHMDELLEKHKDIFEAYLHRDLSITEELIKKHRAGVWEEMGVDILEAKTNGQVAMKHFRSNYMLPGEKFGNYHTWVRRFVLKCSHGAVMVAIKPGEFKDIYENDFSSFYTYASINMGKLPRDERDIRKSYDLNEMLKGVDGWAEVMFEFPDTYKGKKVFPTLPVQEYIPGSKKSSLILFPKKGRSFCTLSEIRVALSLGAEIELVKGYYYKEGTDSWSRFCQTELKLRQQAKKKGNKVGEAIHKNMPNAAVGKLLQNKGDLPFGYKKDMSELIGCPIADFITGVGKLAKDCTAVYQIDAELIRKKYNVMLDEDNKEISTRIGSCWLPEWNSLILGRGRAALWYTVNRHGIDPKHLSTDAFHDKIPLSGEIETPVGKFVIKEERKADMFIGRTKVYVHGDKTAHHAIHLRADKAKELILKGEKAVYIKDKRLTLRDAILEEKQFGFEVEKEMIYNPGYDYKMKILPDGNVRPWEDIYEYFAFMKELKR